MREVLFERHHDPGAAYPRETSQNEHVAIAKEMPNVDERSTEDDGRHEEYEDPVHTHARDVRGRPRAWRFPESTRRAQFARHGQHLEERVERPHQEAVETPLAHVLRNAHDP